MGTIFLFLTLKNGLDWAKSWDFKKEYLVTWNIKKAPYIIMLWVNVVHFDF